GDTADEVAARVQAQEHSIYPLVVRWFCEGRLQMVDGAVQLDGALLGPAGYACE
ncbi:MAG: phosphoribosylglycinamide formyltransferase, partial [Aeromonas veronii]